MKRVALYIRVSTEEQARKGLSLPEQRASLEAYAAAHGFVIVGVYEDPGISARKRYTKRHGLMELLEDAKAGLFDMVLFIKLDRWVRSVRDYYAVQDILDAAGVTWKATQEDYETETASGRLKVNIMLSVAQDEADRTSERIKFVFEGKRARGERTNGKTVLGLKMVNNKPVEDPETIDVVRGMFDAYVRLRSVNAARIWLEEAGYPRCYIVVKRYLKHPDLKPYIEPGTWDLAQEIMQQRAQRNVKSGKVYLFSGLLRCAECGRNLSPDTTVREYRRADGHLSSWQFVYYRCINHALKIKGCPHHLRTREDHLEAWLLEHLSTLAKEYNASVIGAEKKKRKKADPAAVRRKMEKLKDLYLSDLIDKETYAKDYSSLKEQLEESVQEEPAPKTVDVGKLVGLMDGYQSLSREGKKEFWTRILSRIDSFDDGSFSVAFRRL